jgi:hypothetical protein
VNKTYTSRPRGHVRDAVAACGEFDTLNCLILARIDGAPESSIVPGPPRTVGSQQLRRVIYLAAIG